MNIRFNELVEAPSPIMELVCELLGHLEEHGIRLAWENGLDAGSFDQARASNLYGLEHPFRQAPAAPERDIDILFVGNLHPAVQRERLPWLARLARLAGRWRVAIRTGVLGEDYRALLARARVVFNRSIRGEANLRTFEAMTAGALLFQEEGNREVARLFEEGKDYVSYTEENLEERLEYFYAQYARRVAPLYARQANAKPQATK